MDTRGRPGAANYVVALRSSSDDPAGFDVDRCSHERNTDINRALPGCWRPRDPHPDRRHERRSGPGELSASVRPRRWLAAERGIAYVPEDRRRHGVILEMPIAANITMASHRDVFPRGWLRFDRERSIAENYIRNLSIKTAGPDAPAGSLSGGNQQKVSVARWLATNPKILILDEPTQGVDVGAKSEIHKIIRQLAARGLAVLMISSDFPKSSA